MNVIAHFVFSTFASVPPSHGDLCCCYYETRKERCTLIENIVFSNVASLSLMLICSRCKRHHTTQNDNLFFLVFHSVDYLPYPELYEIEVVRRRGIRILLHVSTSTAFSYSKSFKSSMGFRRN